MELTLAVTGVLIAIALYIYVSVTNKKNYWKSRGLESYQTNTVELRDVLNDTYDFFKSKRVKHGGLVLITRPMYFPIDLDIIKMVMVKHFDCFLNHSIKVNEELDPLSTFLPALHDEKWKSLRNKLTPAFSSGKMKMMFNTMVSCSDELAKVLQKETKIGAPINIRDFLARFATDIIGSVGFGIDCNSLNNPNSEFRVYGKKLNVRNWRKTAYKILPTKIVQALGIRAMEKDVEDFFINVTKEMIDYRESKNIYRKDFMHMMLQLKNRGKLVDDEKIMDDDNQAKEYMKLHEVAAQCFVFFSGGFETSSTLMTYALLELAQHEDMQEKLRKEIKESIKKHGGLTYEAVMSMEYLDQVLHESLRKYPPVWATDRVCNKEFRIPGTDVVLEKGTQVIIPIKQIHYDPEYYPEPEKFIPERFSTENKAKRHNMAFLPFGEGPRMCIGARLGLLQSKVGLTAVIANFKVKLNNKTKLPLEYSLGTGIVTVKGDVWLDISELS